MKIEVIYSVAPETLSRVDRIISLLEERAAMKELTLAIRKKTAELSAAIASNSVKEK